MRRLPGLVNARGLNTVPVRHIDGGSRHGVRVAVAAARRGRGRAACPHRAGAAAAIAAAVARAAAESEPQPITHVGATRPNPPATPYTTVSRNGTNARASSQALSNRPGLAERGACLTARMIPSDRPLWLWHVDGSFVTSAGPQGAAGSAGVGGTTWPVQQGGRRADAFGQCPRNGLMLARARSPRRAMRRRVGTSGGGRRRRRCGRRGARTWARSRRRGETTAKGGSYRDS